MGRPRRFPEGTSASTRVAASVAALVEAGGARRTFRLTPETNAALDALLSLPDAPTSATALVEQLILREAAQRLPVATSPRKPRLPSEAQTQRKLDRLLKQYDAE